MPVQRTGDDGVGAGALQAALRLCGGKGQQQPRVGGQCHQVRGHVCGVAEGEQPTPHLLYHVWGRLPNFSFPWLSTRCWLCPFSVGILEANSSYLCGSASIPPAVTVVAQEGGAENGLGVAAAEELQRHKAHPILYLLDLPESIDFSESQSGLNDAFKTLLRECRGLRCPGCGEEANACMALPS